MKVSEHFKNRNPSSVRKAQISFSKRNDKDSVTVINLAIGNISRPMYPAMRKALLDLGTKRKSDGVIKYTPTVGTDKARNAFLNILSAEGYDKTGIYSMVTDGGSSAMELMLLGVCGPASKNPILFLDPTYTNYIDFATRLSIHKPVAFFRQSRQAWYSKLHTIGASPSMATRHIYRIYFV